MFNSKEKPEKDAMVIWVDADACPRMVKELLFRCVQQRHVYMTLVTNHYISHPQSEFIDLVVVDKQFDAADHYIVDKVKQGDLVITADILLAQSIVKQGVIALNPRGEVYDEASIAERVAMRNLMTEFRTELNPIGGSSAYGARDKKKFANALDKYLTLLQQNK